MHNKTRLETIKDIASKIHAQKAKLFYGEQEEYLFQIEDTQPPRKLTTSEAEQLLFQRLEINHVYD